MLLFIEFSIPAIALSSSLSSFPDLEAFEGIQAVVVAPVTLKNMESVKLAPDTLRASMLNQLRKGGISVISEKTLSDKASSVDAPRRKDGMLAADIRRWDSPGFLGTTTSSFAVSLRFYQKARVQPSQRETWVITWLEIKNVQVGTMRPKGIENALKELLLSFILDFNRM